MDSITNQTKEIESWVTLESVGTVGITVEENTCEEGGARNTAPPTTLSEEPFLPVPAT
jgi:hypothetical protein